MPPKSRGSRRPNNGVDNSTEEVFDIISIGDNVSDNSSVVMTGRRPKSPPPTRSRGRAPRGSRGGRGGRGGRSMGQPHPVPDIYQDMLAETLPTRTDSPERPLKRRRTGRRGDAISVDGSANSKVPNRAQKDDEDKEFEDVPVLQKQTAFDESGEDSDDSELAWEAVGEASMVSKSKEGGPSSGGDLELTLSTAATAPKRVAVARRKAVTKAERSLRLGIHKMHVLCLLAHIDMRNEWCNDAEVQKALKPLLNKKMKDLLHPQQVGTQFGISENFKKGLTITKDMWRAKYQITRKGAKQALWAEKEEDLKNFRLPDDIEDPLEKDDFRAAAKKLKGSRDTGAQLFCALLRSIAVEARVVCSLQPLSFSMTGKPSMPVSKQTSSTFKTTTPEGSENEEGIDIRGDTSPFSNNGPTLAAPFSARRRLGHPNAAAYHMPDMSAPASLSKPKPKQRVIRESAYPVFWVEVLDKAYQKWIPVDPLVLDSIAKPKQFEPPASDKENSMTYVIAFEDEGTARDVTRRYAKAYNAKTRKNRVESTEGGERWWKKTMRVYSRGWENDVDQVEDTELAALDAREPMPTAMADLKDHPHFALERHLRRNEVLINRREVGRVAVGRDARATGGKKLEKVFRRSDVKIAKSADGWYRIGREVKLGEQPIKVVASRKKDEEDESVESPWTGLYVETQTEVYEAPPVVNGRVPKNSYGNLDVYVNSMIPKGGVHIPFSEASRAARLLGLDYADAVTGFEFRGRHGTAVINGIIAASEYREAIEATITGFKDEQAYAEEEMRTLAALRLWKRFMVGLRIKERVDGYEIEGEEVKLDEEAEMGEEEDMESEEYIDDGGGGFFPE